MATYSSYGYYTTTQSDTFDLIAYDLYGDEYLASDIVALNPEYSGELIFDAGVELKVPIYDGDTGSETVAPWRRPR
ncbi:MAG: tail protein X [Eggerthellaceae bacterium]|nr:tail protein X [Eggerthellaceae bacterium]